MSKSENEIYEKRWIILFTVVSAAFMSNLDGSIVNIALPDISAKLRVTMASVELVVTSFLINVFIGIMVYGLIYFQDTLKFSVALAGSLMMISPIILSVVAPFSGYLSDKMGSEVLTIIGLTIISIGLFLISGLNEKSSVGVL